MDRYMERALFRQQKDYERMEPGSDSLYSASPDGDEMGPYRGRVRRSSAYTRAMMSDAMRALPFVAGAVMLAAATSRRSSHRAADASISPYA
jgi:hypothetical protein